MLSGKMYTLTIMEVENGPLEMTNRWFCTSMIVSGSISSKEEDAHNVRRSVFFSLQVSGPDVKNPCAALMQRWCNACIGVLIHLQ